MLSVPTISYELDEVMDEPIQDALDILDHPDEICPICFGTKFIGGYRLLNCFEKYFTVKQSPIENNVIYEIGRPGYFEPTHDNASLIFTTEFPAYFTSFDGFRVIDLDGHYKPISNVKIGKQDQDRYNIAMLDLAQLLSEGGLFDVEFEITEPVHGFFVRFFNGDSKIKLNFPFMSRGVVSAKFDYIDVVTAYVGTNVIVSTNDIFYDIEHNKYWKISGVMPKLANSLVNKQDVNLGSELTLMYAEEFEIFSLIPFGGQYETGQTEEITAA